MFLNQLIIWLEVLIAYIGIYPNQLTSGNIQKKHFLNLCSNEIFQNGYFSSGIFDFSQSPTSIYTERGKIDLDEDTFLAVHY